jgi:hypothetical protein
VAGRPSVKPARTPPLIRELTLRGSPRLSASQPVGHNCAKVEERRRRSTSQPGVASLERTPGKRQLFMNTPKGVLQEGLTMSQSLTQIYLPYCYCLAMKLATGPEL